ncbi:MAG TPA: tetratricopeptide repeat protein [Telluria sp.]
MKAWASLCLPLLFSLLAGCASVKPPAPPPALDALLADSLFRPPSEPISTAGLFTLSAEMRAYLDSPEFRAHLKDHGNEIGLVDALYQKSKLKIEYDPRTTRSASETYAARSGNCLSLVIMTAAFARELGLQVHYQSVHADRSWVRTGQLYVASNHVNLSLARPTAPGEPNRNALTIDFLPPEAMGGYRTHSVDEADIVGMYMNNRAAEAIMRGQLDDAYWWARAALLHDPWSATAYNTLGVVYQRHADTALSEQVFRASLEREPENVIVMQNLVPVLDALGKKEEAQALQRRLASIEPYPPFHFFDEGMKALTAGRFEQAKALFGRELARAPYNEEFHFWLAVACLKLGEPGLARKQLALAVNYSTTQEMRGVYSSKLAQLASRAGHN